MKIPKAPSSASYHFQDWYDHAERELSKKEMQEVVDLYLFGDTSTILDR